MTELVLDTTFIV